LRSKQNPIEIGEEEKGANGFLVKVKMLHQEKKKTTKMLFCGGEERREEIFSTKPKRTRKIKVGWSFFFFLQESGGQKKPNPNPTPITTPTY
jgi:hypothetical protein